MSLPVAHFASIEYQNNELSLNGDLVYRSRTYFETLLQSNEPLLNRVTIELSPYESELEIPQRRID